MTFACSVCEAVFSRKFARDRHARNIHSRVEPVYECSHCLKLFAKHGLLKEHRRTHEPTTGFTLNESAIGKNFLSFRKIYATKVSADALLLAVLAHVIANSEQNRFGSSSKGSGYSDGSS